MEGADGARTRARGATERWAFLRTTWACRLWVTSAVVGALVLPPLLAPLGHGRTIGPEALTGLLLVGLSILNVEIGRLLEGGMSDSQRPHKGLSAWAIRAELREDDVLGRFGGEEFCIFLPGVTADDALRVAERIRCGVSSAPVPAAASVTISIGLAAVTPEDDPIEFVAVLTAADHALFQAKNDGRNRTSMVVVDAA
jgi:hypothetical protein